MNVEIFCDRIWVGRGRNVRLSRGREVAFVLKFRIKVNFNKYIKCFIIELEVNLGIIR